MNKQIILCFLCLLSFIFLFGHEEHKHMEDNISPPGPEVMARHFGGRPVIWMQWVGGFHFIFLHLPIALITMTAISEILFTWYPKPIFDYSSRFMLYAAAMFLIPTALLGLIYSYTGSYSGLLADFMWWHMWVGFATVFFAILLAFLRVRLGRSKLYYVNIFILFLLINITDILGVG